MSSKMHYRNRSRTNLLPKTCLTTFLSAMNEKPAKIPGYSTFEITFYQLIFWELTSLQQFDYFLIIIKNQIKNSEPLHEFHMSATRSTIKKQLVAL